MTRRPARRALVALLATGTVLAGAINLRAAVLPAPVITSVVQLVQNVLPGLDRLVASALPAASTPLQIGVGLAPSDPAAEEALYNALYDPASPLYHRFLTPAQIDQQFGVSADRVNSTVSWLQSQGLSVDSVGSGGTFIEATGTVGELDRLLGTTVRTYHAGGTSFLANDSAPHVPGALGIISLVGLNTLQHFSTPHSTTAEATAKAPTASAGQGVAGLYTDSYTPQDLWSLYEQPSDNEGQGQSMAIFGEGASDPVIANLRRFEQMNGLPEVPVVVKRTGAGPWIDNSGEGEWDMDTQASTGMAPQVSQEVLYWGSSLSDAEVANMFSTWVSDPSGPRQGSASFGECETDPLNGLLTNPLLAPLPNAGQQLGNNLEPVAEQILLQATLEGRTLFASTGDTGSSCPILSLPILGAGNGVINQALPLANYPAASRYAVAVGGTVLYAKDGTTPKQRALEYAWPFGGGGSALFIPEPDYQKGVNSVSHPCVASSALQLFALGTVCRGIPDVSAISGDVISNGYTVVGDMVPGTSGGTSLASPTWMGMWTRIQAAAPDQAHGLGFANQVLYTIGEGPHYAQDFHDITVGVNGLYMAKPGWDYVSGWGSPDLSNLMTDIDGTTVPRSDSGPAAVPAAILATTCAPAFVSPAGNATDPVTSADDPQLDITQGELDLTPDGTTLRAVLTIAGLDGTVPSVGQAADYYMYWTYGGATWYAHTDVDRTGRVLFEDGKVGGGKDSVHADAGRLTAGRPGTIEVDIPLGHVGAPPVGARLQFPYASTSMQLATLNLGVDAAGGQDDAVALPCASAPPAPPAPAAPPVSLPVQIPVLPAINLPVIGTLGTSKTAPAAPTPAAPQSPLLGLKLLGIPISLGGSAPATPNQASPGLLGGLLHLLW